MKTRVSRMVNIAMAVQKVSRYSLGEMQMQRDFKFASDPRNRFVSIDWGGEGR